MFGHAPLLTDLDGADLGKPADIFKRARSRKMHQWQPIVANILVIAEHARYRHAMGGFKFQYE